MTDQIPNEQMDKILDATEGCRKIEAIKIYREATGGGLKEAKDFIEALTKQLVEQDPERFAKLAKSGYASVFLLAITASTTMAYLDTGIKRLAVELVRRVQVRRVLR